MCRLKQDCDTPCESTLLYLACCWKFPLSFRWSDISRKWLTNIMAHVIYFEPHVSCSTQKETRFGIFQWLCSCTSQVFMYHAKTKLIMMVSFVSSPCVHVGCEIPVCETSSSWILEKYLEMKAFFSNGPHDTAASVPDSYSGVACPDFRFI